MVLATLFLLLGIIAMISFVNYCRKIDNGTPYDGVVLLGIALFSGLSFIAYAIAQVADKMPRP